MLEQKNQPEMNNQQQLNIDNLLQTITQNFGEIQLQSCILKAQLIEKEQELAEYKKKESQMNNKEDKGE